jgi:hypothetical protein
MVTLNIYNFDREAQPKRVSNKSMLLRFRFEGGKIDGCEYSWKKYSLIYGLIGQRHVRPTYV